MKQKKNKMSNVVKIIGFTDSQTTCECCGKSELKGTYCIEINDEEFYYGSSCAKKTYRWGNKEFKTKINEDLEKRKAEYKNEWDIICKDLCYKVANVYTFNTEEWNLAMIELSSLEKQLKLKHKI